MSKHLALLCCVWAAVGVARPALGSDAGASVPRIAAMLRTASLAVAATTSKAQEHTDEGLRSATLSIGRVLKGTHDTPTATVVESREFPSVPPVLQNDRHGVAFLVRAKATQQLRRTLPRGSLYQTAHGRWGWLELSEGDPAQAELALIERWAALARGAFREPETQQTEIRSLVFAEIASANPRLVEDGVQGIANLSDLQDTLSSQESRTLSTALGRRDLPPRVSERLVRAIESARLHSQLPALRAIADHDPRVVSAAFRARRSLGDIPDAKEVDGLGRDPDPQQRVSAIPLLVETFGVERLREMAISDPDLAVREAAIEAMGASGDPDALPTLGETFVLPDRTLRQKSSQAIYEIGGSPAADLLVGIVFDGPEDAQRHALVLLFSLGLDPLDPRLARVREEHPDAAVRDLALHGFELDH